ncbi:MAG: hypothetical protein GY803_14855, partial [Chloroflexi bacterium]|nr:hypothetical protein [Chloroflexota bacterium]
VLSLRNEAGLRLPDESALTQLGAELLTCLTATPLRDLPEQIAAVNGVSFTTEPPLFSVGLHGWRWSPAKTHCCFTNRWLENVVTHWLAAADNAPLLEAVTLWLQTEGITLDNLAAPLLKEEERPPPHLNAPGWQMPWPWDFAALITEMNFTNAADGERCAQIQEQAALRLAEPLQQATNKLQKFVQTTLDSQPTAGLSHTQCWLQQASDVWDSLMDEVLDKADRLAATGADLGGRRGQLEADIQQRMTSWPTVSTAAWFRVAMRPWRWPRLVWQYRRIRELGQQLADVLTRQAEWRRQTILNQLLRRAVADLDHFTRHLHGQVEEIGDMLQYLASENLPARDDVAAKREERFALITPLSVPWKLYEQLIPAAAAEAVTAAAAVGGLGRQVKLLDDTIWEPLRRFGQERLASVWDLTAVDVLSTWSDNHDSSVTHWQPPGTQPGHCGGLKKRCWMKQFAGKTAVTHLSVAQMPVYWPISCLIRKHK